MKLAYIICVLLISEATAVSLIRTDTSLINSHEAAEITSDGRVVADRTLQDANTAQDILNEVREFAEAGWMWMGGEPRPEDKQKKIDTIEELTRNLEAALMTEHKIAGQEVDANLAAIKKCNTEQANALTKIATTHEAKVEERRQTHLTCRQEEVVSHADMTMKCNKLKRFLKGLDGPEKPENKTAEVVQWVNKMDDYWCEKGPIAKEKSSICKKAKKDHAAHKEKCDGLQRQFELGFCQWRVKLIDVCDVQTGCYDDALDAYDKHVDITTQKVEKWKIEYTALKKINCYINVWLTDKDASTADSEKLDACIELDVDDSVMEVDFKEPEEKALCSLEKVAKFPGTHWFVHAEYSSPDDYTKMVADVTPCDAATCAAMTCFAEGWIKRSNPELILGSTDENCCQPTCAAYECSSTILLKNPDANNEVEPTDCKCCEASCASHKCPPGWVFKPNHTMLDDPSNSRCCEATCDAFSCEEGWIKKSGVADMKNPTNDKCCQATCAAYLECETPGWVKKADSEKIKSFSEAQCCEPTCDSYKCRTKGWLKQLEAAGAVKPTEDKCCEASCAAHQCKHGWVKMDGVKDERNPSDDSCCEPTCASYSCSKNGWVKIAGSGSRKSPDEETCCQPTCATHSCATDGWVKKSGVDSLINPTDAICCEATCAAFACESSGWVKKEGSDGLRHPSEGTCCEETCDAYQCSKSGYVKRQGFGSKRNPDEDTCCEPTCDSYSCKSSGWVKKDGSELFKNPTEKTCCEPTCATYSCATDGWVKKADADDELNPSDSQCCESTCATYSTCTNSGWVKRANAISITEPSEETCCEATCSVFECEDGLVKRENVDDKINPSQASCCEPSCASKDITCRPGWLKKPDYNEINDPSHHECCDATCGAFSCSSGFVKKDNVGSIIDLSDANCCQPTCSMYTCKTSGWVKKANSKDFVDPSESTCCEPTCASYTCDTSGWIKKTAVAKLRNPNEGTCCEATCGSYTCSKQGWLKKNGVTGARKPSEDKCCEATCDAFTCEAGFIKKAKVSTITDLSNDNCCQPTCSAHQCPAGWNKRHDVGLATNPSDAACCEQTCSAYTCQQPGWKPKDTTPVPTPAPTPAPGRAKMCTLNGDPHVKTFDGKAWHPVFAPGHWWLVNTANGFVKIQATYGGVGVKTNRGWQSRRLKGIPTTGVTSMAISGKFLKDNVLVIQSSCDWDYDSMKCLSSQPFPRITWNGKKIEHDVTMTNPNLSIKNVRASAKSRRTPLQITLPNGVVVKMFPWGNWKPATSHMAFQAHITMPQFKTEICGHCGDFDGRSSNDNMFKGNGFASRAPAGSLCDAAVHCKDRLISSETFGKYATGANTQACEENKPVDVDYSIEDCPAEHLKEAKAVCDAEFAKQGHFSNKEIRDESYAACLLDACLDKHFANPDATEAKEIDEEEAPAEAGYLELEKVDDDTCCEPTCASHKCPAGHIQKIGVANQGNPSDSMCCEATCDTFDSCPAGWKKKFWSGIRNPSQSTCCLATCAAHRCAKFGQVKKANPAEILGSTDEKCCQDTCASFQCSNGHTKKKHVDDRLNPSDGICCDRHWDYTGGVDGCKDCSALCRFGSFDNVVYDRNGKSCAKADGKFCGSGSCHQCKCLKPTYSTCGKYNCKTNGWVKKLGVDHLGHPNEKKCCEPEGHPGFENGHIVHWMVTETYSGQKKGFCGVELNSADALYYTGHGGEWERYFKSGHRNAGCGGACNGDNGVNLECHYIGQSRGHLRGVSAFAKTYIVSDAARTVQLQLGSDDGIAVWLNGKSVHQNLRACRCYADNQDRVNIRLNKGVNLLVVKIGENDGHFGFTARITNVQGLRAKEQADYVPAVALPSSFGFDGTYIVNWMIQETYSKQTKNFCGVVLNNEIDPLFTSGIGGDWVRYFRSGSKYDGCGGACNGGKGVNMECHYTGRSAMDYAFTQLNETNATSLPMLAETEEEEVEESHEEEEMEGEAAEDDAEEAQGEGEEENEAEEAAEEDQEVAEAEEGEAKDGSDFWGRRRRRRRRRRAPPRRRRRRRAPPPARRRRAPPPRKELAKDLSAFAKTYLVADSAKTVQLRLGSDDGIAAWVNGVSVWKNLRACRCYADNQDRVNIRLNKGVNLLVVKIGERGGNMGFVAQLSQTQGIKAFEQAPYVPQQSLPSGYGFDNRHIVNWMVQKQYTAQQARYCGVQLSSAHDNLYASGNGEWMKYFKSGYKNAGCGGACNHDNGVNLECHYGGRSNSGIKYVNAFAKTHLVSNADRTVQLQLGSDDGIAVWLNGKPVFQNLRACRCYGDNQDRVSISLKKGVNLLAIKIGENDGHFGFSAMLDNTNGIQALEMADYRQK